jgi:hypothetical protein
MNEENIVHKDEERKVAIDSRRQEEDEAYMQLPSDDFKNISILPS